MAKSKTTKLCPECNRTKGTHLFFKRGKNKDGLSTICKSCYKQTDAYRNRLNRDYMRQYGITLDEYEDLFNEQNGRCFICGKQPRNRRLAVDHDHALEEEGLLRGSVRGLLCRTCNEFLGHIGDSLRVAARLREYLGRGPRFPE